MSTRKRLRALGQGTSREDGVIQGSRVPDAHAARVLVALSERSGLTGEDAAYALLLWMRHYLGHGTGREATAALAAVDRAAAELIPARALELLEANARQLPPIERTA